MARDGRMTSHAKRRISGKSSYLRAKIPTSSSSVSRSCDEEAQLDPFNYQYNSLTVAQGTERPQLHRKRNEPWKWSDRSCLNTERILGEGLVKDAEQVSDREGCRPVLPGNKETGKTSSEEKKRVLNPVSGKEIVEDVERVNYGEYLALAKKQGGETETTLLQLCQGTTFQLDTKRNCTWESVRKWLANPNHDIKKKKQAMMDVDDEGFAPLHLACHKNAPFDIVRDMLKIDERAIWKKDKRGRLPLHLACDAPCSGEVIFAIFEKHPSSASERNGKNQNPFYSKQPEMETMLKFIIECNEDDDIDNPRQMCYSRLELCKNYLPSDMFQRAMLEHRKSPYGNGWLNKMSCNRKLVAQMMLEFYLHIALGVFFIQASRLYLAESDPVSGWAITIIFIAAVFLVLEIQQLVRMKEEPAIYFLNFWNWVDCTAIALAIASAAKILTEELSKDKTAVGADIHQLLMVTGLFLGLFFASYLKKTFFPFSTFVGGMVNIIWVLLPFFMVTWLILGVFTFMYFVQNHKTVKHKSPLQSSYAIYFSFLGGGPGQMESLLDVVFGALVVVVLLNVVIAIVGNAWSDVTENAEKVFWTYRLHFIIKATKAKNIDSSDATGKPEEDWTMRVLKQYLGIGNMSNGRNSGPFYKPTTDKQDTLLIVGATIIRLAGRTLLGLFSFGYFWPMFVLEFLFTSRGAELKSSVESTSQIKKLSDTIEKQEERIQSIASGVGTILQRLDDANFTESRYDSCMRDSDDGICDYINSGPTESSTRMVDTDSYQTQPRRRLTLDAPAIQPDADSTKVSTAKNIDIQSQSTPTKNKRNKFKGMREMLRKTFGKEFSDDQLTKVLNILDDDGDGIVRRKEP